MRTVLSSFVFIVFSLCVVAVVYGAVYTTVIVLPNDDDNIVCYSDSSGDIAFGGTSALIMANECVSDTIFKDGFENAP